MSFLLLDHGKHSEAEDLIKRAYFGKMPEKWSVFETNELLFIRAKDKINRELPLNTLYATSRIT